MVEKERKPNEERNAPTGQQSPPGPERCSGTTKYGRPCQKDPLPGKGVCWNHDPEKAEERARVSSLGGKAATRRSPRSLEIAELKDELKTLIREVKENKIAPGVAAVITQLANTVIRAIEQDRKVTEQEQIVERIEELERRAEDGNTRQAA